MPDALRTPADVAAMFGSTERALTDARRKHVLERLRLVAADSGPFHGHSQIVPHEAAVILAEIGRLRGIVRVSLLRHVPGATHAAIDALLDGEQSGE